MALCILGYCIEFEMNLHKAYTTNSKSYCVTEEAKLRKIIPFINLLTSDFSISIPFFPWF